MGYDDLVFSDGQFGVYNLLGFTLINFMRIREYKMLGRLFRHPNFEI